MMHAVASDHTVRLWNYETLKCEIVHNFRTDELFSVAIHPSGFRVLVGFKVSLAPIQPPIQPLSSPLSSSASRSDCLVGCSCRLHALSGCTGDCKPSLIGPNITLT